MVHVGTSVVSSIATTLTESSVGKRLSDSSKQYVEIEELKNVAKTSIKSIDTVMVSFSSSCENLVSAVKSGTAKIVNKQYGEEAEELSRDTIDIVQNITKTAMNCSKLNVHSIALATTSSSAQKLIQDKSPEDEIENSGEE